MLNGKGREFVISFAPKYSILKSSPNPRDLEPKAPWIVGRVVVVVEGKGWEGSTAQKVCLLNYNNHNIKTAGILRHGINILDT